MSAIQRLVGELSRLPGVGARTANRMVFHLMRGPREDTLRLSTALADLAERVQPCRECGNYSEEELCQVCRDPRRDLGLLCVVEGAFDIAALEGTGRFGGRYHVLGGHLSPLDGIGPDALNVASLLDRIRAGNGAVREVILATNPSVEGEATAVFLEGLLRPLGMKVTRLARGIPMGSDLEYVDGTTLAEALDGRKEM